MCSDITVKSVTCCEDDLWEMQHTGGEEKDDD